MSPRVVSPNDAGELPERGRRRRVGGAVGVGVLRSTHLPERPEFDVGRDAVDERAERADQGADGDIARVRVWLAQLTNAEQLTTAAMVLI